MLGGERARGGCAVVTNVNTNTRWEYRDFWGFSIDGRREFWVLSICVGTVNPGWVSEG